MNWWQSWDLRFDPFFRGAIPFVATPEHEEAVARVVHQIRSGEPRIPIEGESGSGTSAILRECLGRIQARRTKVSLVRCPWDEWSMIRGLALGLGVRLGPGQDRSEGYGRVSDALWLAARQGFSVILAIDDAHHLESGSFEKLVAIGKQAGGKTTVVSAGGPENSCSGRTSLDVPVRIRRLTRTMTESYLSEKLRGAGRVEPVLTDRAMTGLHARSWGLPRQIDRLARLSLIAGARDRLTLIPVEVIAEVSREFQEFPDLAITPN